MDQLLGNDKQPSGPCAIQCLPAEEQIWLGSMTILAEQLIMLSMFADEDTQMNLQVLRHAPTEEQLWGYAAQLAAALRAVHGAGLTCRAAALHPSKVLLVSPGRIRIGAC